ncbi:MAG TPA: DUF423 domain-containing protein [Alphaproteobacteria bacterium]|nr:DUF423 domain-containing protein [Alphaproteobacteria bacterium]
MLRAAQIFAGLSGALAVALGAWAAHGLEARFGVRAAELVRLGSQYQLVHALALLAALALAGQGAGRRAARVAAGGFMLGSVLFCGALYALAFGLPRGFGAVAPLGGLAFIAGWLALAFCARR